MPLFVHSGYGRAQSRIRELKRGQHTTKDTFKFLYTLYCTSQDCFLDPSLLSLVPNPVDILVQQV